MAWSGERKQLIVWLGRETLSESLGKEDPESQRDPPQRVLATGSLTAPPSPGCSLRWWEGKEPSRFRDSRTVLGVAGGLGGCLCQKKQQWSQQNWNTAREEWTPLGPPGREGTCSCSGSGYRQLSHVLKRGGLGSMFLSCHLGLVIFPLKERGI